MFCSLHLYTIIGWILKDIPARNGRGGQIAKSTYATGRRSMRTCAHNGEEGSNPCHFGAHANSMIPNGYNLYPCSL